MYHNPWNLLPGGLQAGVWVATLCQVLFSKKSNMEHLMKMNLLLPAGLVAITLGLAAGCASTPEEPAAPAAAPTVDEAAAKKAIADAKAAYAEASKLGVEWRDTGELIKQAEAALAAGDYAKAVVLANQAKSEAERAIAQSKSEKARLAGASQDNAASRNAGGSANSYSVARGDSLWSISGKSEIYGNAYQWPLIYKANRDKIKDADLIHPDQVLSIDRNASDADVNAAIQHAKTRGAWSLGAVEESDTAYLSK
jgi:hypothetical protein